MDSFLQMLLITYTSILIINFGLNLFLARFLNFTRGLFSSVLFLWGVIGLNFLVQIFFGEANYKQYLAFSSGILVSYAYARVSELFLNRRLPKKNLMWFASLLLIISGFFIELIFQNLALTSWFPSFAIATPILVYGGWLISNHSHQKMAFPLGFLMMLQGIHFLDYPLLRFMPNGAIIGFTIAMLLVIGLNSFLYSALLEKTFSEQEAKLQELVVQRTEQLRASLEDNRTLVNILTHDLGNQIMVMNSYFESGKLNSSPGLERAHNALKHIIELTNKVRDFSRFGLTSKALKLENIRLSDIWIEVRACLGDRLERKRISMEITESPDLSVLVDQEIFLNQILLNLLTNSIKFSSPGSSIEITARPCQEHIEIEIVDHGIGIPKEIMNDLFKLGESVSRPGTLKEKGTGFGLHLARTCVLLMGGDLIITSPLPNGGNGTRAVLFIQNARVESLGSAA